MNAAGRRRHRRRLRQRHLPRREPDRGALRPALYRRRRRGRRIVTRGLKNTFRFGPGFGVIAKTALDNLVTINDQAGKAGEDRDDRARGLGVRRRPREAPERATARARLPGARDHLASDADARLQQRRAARSRRRTPISSFRPTTTTSTSLLARTMQQQSVRPKGIYSVLGGAASSYKFVKEFPEAAQYIMDCNHWFDPKNPKALALKKKIEDKGEFYTYEVYMNYSCVLLLADAIERAGERRPRQDHRRARKLDLRRPRHAVWPDQVRQRPEPGRRAGQHAGAQQRHPGDLPGRVRVGEGRCSRCRRPDAPARRRRAAPPPSAMLSSVILVPAVLNGLMTGAVYALVALGLTLIYGVLHIINFAHGALLTAAMFAAFFAHKLLGLDPYLAALGADAAVLPAGLRPAALRHRSGRARRGPQHPAGDARPRGRDRERAALRVPRRHPHDQPALRLRRRRSRHARSSRVPRVIAFVVVDRRGARAVAHHAMDRHRQGDPRRRQGEARRRARRASTSRTSMRSRSASAPPASRSPPAC